MEQNTSLFEFGIDDMSRLHLAETAKWARFLSIVGFIICGLTILGSFFVGSYLTTSTSQFERFETQNRFEDLRIFFTIFYLVLAVLFFFPCLFLLRFANQMTTALNTNEQHTLNNSFQNLKRMFRFVGITTIVLIALYIFGIIVTALM